MIDLGTLIISVIVGYLSIGVCVAIYFLATAFDWEEDYEGMDPWVEFVILFIFMTFCWPKVIYDFYHYP